MKKFLKWILTALLCCGLAVAVIVALLRFGGKKISDMSMSNEMRKQLAACDSIYAVSKGVKTEITDSEDISIMRSVAEKIQFYENGGEMGLTNYSFPNESYFEFQAAETGITLKIFPTPPDYEGLVLIVPDIVSSDFYTVDKYRDDFYKMVEKYGIMENSSDNEALEESTETVTSN